MGLADRDYARTTPTGRPPIGWTPAGFRGVSFNTWLIIINVVVFLLGNAAPRTYQQMGVAGAPEALLPLAQTPDLTDQQSLVDPNIHTASHWIDPRTRLIVAERVESRPAQGVYIRSRSQPGWIADHWYRFDYISGPGGATIRVPEFVKETRYMPMRWTDAVGHFSTAAAFFRIEVWRFVTFQFLHADFSHILLNMIGLWFFGPLVEQHLRSRKRYAAYYLACGIFGAILYLILNLLGWAVQSAGMSVPGLLFNDPYMPLIGASAGVFGVLMASAYIAGNQIMYVFMVIPMKIRTGAYLLTAGALVNLLLRGGNAGGDAAHLGGAIAGFFFIRNMHLLRDFFDVFGTARSDKPPSRRTAARDRKIDQILAKVSRDGMQSLTPKERRLLEKAGTNGGKGRPR